MAIVSMEHLQFREDTKFLSAPAIRIVDQIATIYSFGKLTQLLVSVALSVSKIRRLKDFRTV